MQEKITIWKIIFSGLIDVNYKIKKIEKFDDGSQYSVFDDIKTGIDIRTILPKKYHSKELITNDKPTHILTKTISCMFKKKSKIKVKIVSTNTNNNAFNVFYISIQDSKLNDDFLINYYNKELEKLIWRLSHSVRAPVTNLISMGVLIEENNINAIDIIKKEMLGQVNKVDAEIKHLVRYYSQILNKKDPNIEKVYQINVTLKDSWPIIFRTITVLNNYTFKDLHKLLCVCFNWSNLKEYEFILNDNKVLCTEKLNSLNNGLNCFEAMSTKICDFCIDQGQSFIYIYDKNDKWEHSLTIERILPLSNITIPVCINGQMNTPPEDCGGISDFNYLTFILKFKNHIDYPKALKKIPRGYDKFKFDIKLINKNINKIFNIKSKFVK